MTKQEILQELKSLVYENFGIEIFDISKSLFSFDIGFVPRDLVKLVMLIEHKFNVRFSESELGRDEHHFDFGVMAFMISQAIDADYVIMNLLYNKSYTEAQMEEIKQVCRFSFNFEIDSFHLSNTLLDPTSFAFDRLKFFKLGKREYEQKINGLYDLLNPADMDKMYEDMITKLSSYNVNQIF